MTGEQVKLNPAQNKMQNFSFSYARPAYRITYGAIMVVLPFLF
jgi:hypothetical protein